MLLQPEQENGKLNTWQLPGCFSVFLLELSSILDLKGPDSVEGRR